LHIQELIIGASITAHPKINLWLKSSFGFCPYVESIEYLQERSLLKQVSAESYKRLLYLWHIICKIMLNA